MKISVGDVVHQKIHPINLWKVLEIDQLKMTVECIGAIDGKTPSFGIGKGDVRDIETMTIYKPWIFEKEMKEIINDSSFG